MLGAMRPQKFKTPELPWANELHDIIYPPTTVFNLCLLGQWQLIILCYFF